MSIRRHTRFLIPAVALMATALAAEKAAPAKPGSAPALGARFSQVRQRAAALFQHRNQVPATPVPEENPFRVAGVAPTRATTGESERPVASTPTELAVLQQAVATLRVSGIVEKEGVSYLVINSKPYRVGDVVQATVQGEIVYLRVREIVRNSVTLALNETELVLNGTQAPR